MVEEISEEEVWEIRKKARMDAMATCIAIQCENERKNREKMFGDSDD